LKKLISVSLRPDDPFAKRLLSTPVRTNNLLLKVTVPKRTGRKRKRGTSGPFLSEEEIENNAGNANKTYVHASTIYRSLQDNASTYKVALAGIVDETHRFRSKCQNSKKEPGPDLSRYARLAIQCRPK
jgi:general transcription factor 3C polypeptide 5 (transcription factor C subunit 1)